MEEAGSYKGVRIQWSRVYGSYSAINPLTSHGMNATSIEYIRKLVDYAEWQLNRYPSDLDRFYSSINLDWLDAITR